MRMFRVMVAAVLLAAWPSAASAQTDAGRISGSVRDQSGAFVAGATVTIKNERTGETRTAITNDQGYFLIAPLRPSEYTIKSQKSGFGELEFTSMPVAVGQELALDFELKPAGVEEAVTVVGVAPILDISSARIGANVSQREVQGLPVNGRQMSQLMLQAPGSQNAGTGTWQDIRFSGRAVEQNVIKYDGVEGSAIIDAAPGNVNGENNTPFKLQASLENVQEFRVESSNYPAEFGTGTGGQVSVVTKSGTNRFHGALFEYLRDDKLDAPNYFDSQRNTDGSVITELPKSLLRQNQFGGSFGGPVVRDRAFFFVSYEGYRLDAGKNFIESVPSDAAWARAVPAVAALRPGFLAPGARILPGASSDPNAEIAQLQADQHVRENSFGGRFDFRMNDNWSAYVRVFHDRGRSDAPEGVTGRSILIEANPSNAVFNLQGLLGGGTINEFKVGYNAAQSTYRGVAPLPNFSNILVNLGGTVANTGIAGQGSSTGLAVPGGLVRVNSAGNGQAAPYDPFSLTFSDSVSRVAGNHYLKVGGEARLIRMSTDQLGGITYTYANINSFMANTPTQVQYFGDLSEPSPFSNGAAGEKHIEQEYYVAFAQDEWRVRPNLTLNYGLRYDYYVPLRERDNRIVKFNIDNGVLDPQDTPFYVSKKNNLQPRVSATFSPWSKTVLRGGFGVFVGPGQTEDQIQPIEAERISTTVSSGALNAFPLDPAQVRPNFINNPNNRTYQPRAYANEYTLPEKVYQYTASVQQELGPNLAATVAYVGSQGRNLFLRSVANRIIGVQSNGAAAATVIREFDIVTRAADGTIASIQRPFAEVDYKTSGGHDSYNGMQLSLTRRSVGGLTTNVQYTLGYSKGNTGGSNEATTASNNARALSEFDFEDGYNNFDVRHTFNLSALYSLPMGRGRKFLSDAGAGTQALLGGWDIGGILNARSGLPVPVLITRNDIVYVDGAGNVWNNAAADRVATINTPGGGASRSTRRPDLVPGVDPFVISKRFDAGRGSNIEFRAEIFNLFNITNFSSPIGTLPNALPGAGETVTQANRVQPGQPYTNAAAGTFGRLSSTVGTTVGLGTPRQVQFGFRYNF
jgi:hypothetical protein